MKRRNKNYYLNIEQSKDYTDYQVSKRWKTKQSELILQMHTFLLFLLTKENSETIATTNISLLDALTRLAEKRFRSALQQQCGFSFALMH